MSGRDFEAGSDLDLLDRARERPETEESRRAASELLGRYQERVYIWCFRYVREHERARDLAQDVLINAYRNIGSFGGRSQFASWLFAIARNRCISEMRRVSIVHDEEIDPDEIAIGGRDPMTELEESLDEQAILDLIRERLTAVEQEAIWLRCWDRMPYPAITRILGIRQASGARGVLQQARRKLKAALASRDAGKNGAQT
jgi:RNA polymerase sigma factor (sigma-70 family)